ncbi:MAG: hypothetical protein ABIB43_01065 [archaeon]
MNTLDVIALTTVTLTNIASFVHTVLPNKHGQEVGGIVKNYRNFLQWAEGETAFDNYKTGLIGHIPGIPLSGLGVFLGTIYNKASEKIKDKLYSK